MPFFLSALQLIYINALLRMMGWSLIDSKGQFNSLIKHVGLFYFLKAQKSKIFQNI